MKVALLSTIEPTERDVHWASPYFALSRAFMRSPSHQAMLVKNSDEADLIIVCARLRNPAFPVEILTRTKFWKHYSKTIVLSTDDSPIITHPGIYTGNIASGVPENWCESGFYPHVAFNDNLDDAIPVEPSLLFSFRGAVSTHPVRQRMLECARTQWKFDASVRQIEFEYLNVNSPVVEPVLSVQEYEDSYVKSLASAKFILCPRGRCPASMRLFEAMRAARVPVVISDEWRRPSRVPWVDFVIQIRESDVANLPELLLAHEAEFRERSALAHRAWDRYFSAKAMPETVLELAAQVQKQRRSAFGGRLGICLALLLLQVPTWRFIRRGSISELARLVRKHSR